MRARVVFWQLEPGMPRDSLVFEFSIVPSIGDFIDDSVNVWVIREAWHYPLEENPDDRLRLIVLPAPERPTEAVREAGRKAAAAIRSKQL